MNQTSWFHHLHSQMIIFSFSKNCQTDQTGAWGAGIRGWREGWAGLILFPLMQTNACADRAALPCRGHLTHTVEAWTRCLCTHHTTVLYVKTHIYTLNMLQSDPSTTEDEWITEYQPGLFIHKVQNRKSHARPDVFTGLWIKGILHQKLSCCFCTTHYVVLLPPCLKLHWKYI